MALAYTLAHYMCFYKTLVCLGNKTDLSSIITDEQIINVITPQIKDLSRQYPPSAFTLVINFDPRKSSISESITSYCIAGEDYNDFQEQISKGLKSNLIFVIRLYISRTGRPRYRLFI